MNIGKILCVFLGLLFLCPNPVSAAFKKTTQGQGADTVSAEKVWNPDSLPDDVILPLPCGLSMAMRGVNVPLKSLVSDYPFQMGVNNVEDEGRSLYASERTGHVAASFTASELPKSWLAKLAQKKGSINTWYFIGKYEISDAQWSAVMDALNSDGVENPAMCPKEYTIAQTRPKVGISWFDIQDFLNKYNAWLVKNHSKELPIFNNTRNIGFLRLPTEEEWEYAARGVPADGIPKEWWNENDFFPPIHGNDGVRDYGIFTEGTGLSNPASIGSRQPNPLGIYDTIGNAAELVDGFFRMTIPDIQNGKVQRRLHGASGGMLIKGGSYKTTDIDELKPGWREEIPLYTTSGDQKTNDLGFRLVLASINMASSARSSSLSEALKKAESGNSQPEQTQVNIDNKNTPLEVIDALVQTAEGDSKKNLRKLRSMVADREVAQANENVTKLNNSLRALLYLSETIRSFAFRYSIVYERTKKIKELIANADSPENRKSFQAGYAKAQSVLNDYKHSMEMSANFYKMSLDAVAREPEAEIKRQLELLIHEYSGPGVFDTHMIQNLKQMQKWIELVQKKGAGALTQKAILSGVLPPDHYKMMSAK